MNSAPVSAAEALDASPRLSLPPGANEVPFESGAEPRAENRPAAAPIDAPITAKRLVSHRRIDTRIQLGMVLADILTLMLATFLAYFVRQLTLGSAADLSLYVWDSVGVIAVGWLFAIIIMRGYNTRLIPAGPEMYRAVVHASFAAAGLVGAVVYLTNSNLSRAFFLVFFLVGPILLVLNRFILRRMLNGLRARGRFRLPVLAVGSIAHVDAIARTVQRETWLGYDIVGAATPADETSLSSQGIPVLGRESSLYDLVQKHEPSVLLFAPGSDASPEDYRRVAWQLEDHDIDVIVAPALSEISSDRVELRPVAGLPLVHFDPPRARQSLKWSKRAFDIVVAMLALIVLSPVLALIALAVKREDGGPVIFRQSRIGQSGEPFVFLKFRSMVADADDFIDELRRLREQDRGNDIMFKMVDDPRVTRIGRFIRRYSLDELPQLWNVIRGDMSLVGPRPALPREVAQYDDDARRRLSVRPGITGLWQVSGRSDLSWEETIRLDTYYVDNWSFVQDLQILVRTIRAVLASSGAY